MIISYKDLKIDSINKYKENFNSYFGAGLFLLCGIFIFTFFLLLANYLAKSNIAYSGMYILVILSFIFVLYPSINMSFLKIGIINENIQNNTNVFPSFISFYLFSFRHPSKGALKILSNILLCALFYVLIGATLIDYIIFSIYQSFNPDFVNYINAYYSAIANADFYALQEILSHLQIPIMISDITCGILIVSYLVHRTSLNFIAFALKLSVFPRNVPAPNKVVYAYTKEIKAMSNGDWKKLYYGSNWPLIVLFYFSFILCNVLLAIFNPNKDGIFILAVSLLISSVLSIIFIPYFYNNVYSIVNYLTQEYLNTLLLNNLNELFNSPSKYDIPPEIKSALEESKHYVEDLVKKQNEKRNSEENKKDVSDNDNSKEKIDNEFTDQNNDVLSDNKDDNLNNKDSNKN